MTLGRITEKTVATVGESRALVSAYTPTPCSML